MVFVRMYDSSYLSTRGQAANQLDEVSPLIRGRQTFCRCEVFVAIVRLEFVDESKYTRRIRFGRAGG